MQKPVLASSDEKDTSYFPDWAACKRWTLRRSALTKMQKGRIRIRASVRAVFVEDNRRALSCGTFRACQNASLLVPPPALFGHTAAAFFHAPLAEHVWIQNCSWHVLTLWVAASQASVVWSSTRNNPKATVSSCDKEETQRSGSNPFTSSPGPFRSGSTQQIAASLVQLIVSGKFALTRRRLRTRLSLTAQTVTIVRVVCSSRAKHQRYKPWPCGEKTQEVNRLASTEVQVASPTSHSHPGQGSGQAKYEAGRERHWVFWARCVRKSVSLSPGTFLREEEAHNWNPSRCRSHRPVRRWYPTTELLQSKGVDHCTKRWHRSR